MNTPQNPQLHKHSVMWSQCDDDAMVDWYMDNQPILTDEVAE